MLEEIVFDQRLCRFRDVKTGRLIAQSKIELSSFLSYRLIKSLDRKTAMLLCLRLQKIQLPIIKHRGNGRISEQQDSIVLRGKIAMALNDLENIIAKEIIHV